MLAPSLTAIPNCFNNICNDANLYNTLLENMQRLRAEVYFRDGAVQASQLTNGRHRHPLDEGSWHLLLQDGIGHVCGCARYREYVNCTGFSQLGVSSSQMAKCPDLGTLLQSSVEAELELSRHLDLPYVELGGWALLEHIRGSTEAIRMALTTYSLSQALGGGVGISTATIRNASASILRRIGGLPLTHRKGELPPYHDPQYDCVMEVLRFYSWAPSPRYTSWISGLKGALSNILIVTDGLADSRWKFRRDVGTPVWQDLKVRSATADHANGESGGFKDTVN